MRTTIPDVPELFRQWHSGVPVQDIASHFGVSSQIVYAARNRYGLPKRPRQSWRERDDPSPEQIAERAAAIKERNLAKMRAQP